MIIKHFRILPITFLCIVFFPLVVFSDPSRTITHVELTFLIEQMRDDNQEIIVYSDRDSFGDIGLRVSDSDLKINGIRLWINEVEQGTRMNVIKRHNHQIIRTSVIDDFRRFSEGNLTIKVVVETEMGSLVREITVYNDRTKPRIILQEPFDQMQRIFVEDNKRVTDFKVFIHDGEEFHLLKGLKEIRREKSEREYEFHLDEDMSWWQVVYQVSDGMNYQQVMATGDPKTREGMVNVYNRYFNQSKAVQPSIKNNENISLNTQSTGGTYSADVYIPFGYDHNSSSPFTYEVQLEKAQERWEVIKSNLDLAINDYFNINLVNAVGNKHFLPLTPDFKPIYMGLEISHFMNIKQNYPDWAVFHITFDTLTLEPRVAITTKAHGLIPFTLNSWSEDMYVDPHHSVSVVKKKDRQVIMVFDDFEIGTSCGATNYVKGMMALKYDHDNPMFISSGNFCSHFDESLIYAHEMGHSLTLNHVDGNPNNIMSFGSIMNPTAYTLSVAQRKNIATRIYGDPPEILVLKEQSGGGFGENIYYTSDFHFCGNGMMEEGDWCEVGVVDVAFDFPGWCADENYIPDTYQFMPKWDWESGSQIVEWPDYESVCIIDGPFYPAPYAQEGRHCRGSSPPVYGLDCPGKPDTTSPISPNGTGGGGTLGFGRPDGSGGGSSNDRGDEPELCDSGAPMCTLNQDCPQDACPGSESVAICSSEGCCICANLIIN